MKITIKAWLTNGHVLPRPLLDNPMLPCLLGIPDPIVWQREGIQTLNNIFQMGALCTFDSLRNTTSPTSTSLDIFNLGMPFGPNSLKQLLFNRILLEPLLRVSDLTKPLP